MNNSLVVNERPHTISTAYEKGGHHQRPALSVYTFQPLEDSSTASTSTATVPVEYETLKRCRDLKASGTHTGSAASSQESLSQRPPLPQRCSSLERPATTKVKDKVNKKKALVLAPPEADNVSSILPDFHQAAPDMSNLTFF